VLAIVAIAIWIKDARRELDELPLDAHGEG